ncbi:MAG: hypothetical protein F6K24_33950 [Okeania sp. SIO2D1]|nr:hypothetical protein [Okeania sp. SIO2D1]
MLVSGAIASQIGIAEGPDEYKWGRHPACPKISGTGTGTRTGTGTDKMPIPQDY